MRLAMEEDGTRSAQALAIIGQNIDQAADGEGAICQDTGMPTFEIKTPVGVNQIWMKQQIRAAVAEATRRGKLRPNSVDSLTGENTGNNLGPGTPIFHFEQWERDEIEVKLILKGGGCENMNAQYSLPTELPHLGRADRTSTACASASSTRCGRRRARAAGRARSASASAATAPPATWTPRSSCSARSTTSTAMRGWPGSKPRSCGPSTRWVSARWDSAASVSLIGCKVGALNRLPASFFVSVAYDCWAFRRLGVVLDAATGAIDQWLYRDPAVATLPMMDQAGFQRTGREVRAARRRSTRPPCAR